MSKNSSFRGTLEKQHGQWDQKCWNLNDTICWSVWREFSSKTSLLVICKILGLFVNTLTARHKFSLLNRNKSTQPIQMQLSKNVARQISKKSSFRGPFDNQHGKWDQTVPKSEWHHFYDIYWSLWRQLSSKKSQDCFLIHWLLNRSILFLIETTWGCQLRCIYLSKGKLFLNFFSTILKCR